MRRVAGDAARVTLQLRQRSAVRQPPQVRELVAALRAQAARHEAMVTTPPQRPGAR